MKITQTFRSALDDVDIDTMVLGANSSAPLPSVGDIVEWTGKNKAYFGKVRSRLISYSPPQLAVGRDDDFDVNVVLNVVLEDKEI
jgi:hypothetical protein